MRKKEGGQNGGTPYKQHDNSADLNEDRDLTNVNEGNQESTTNFGTSHNYQYSTTLQDIVVGSGAVSSNGNAMSDKYPTIGSTPKRIDSKNTTNSFRQNMPNFGIS